MGGDAADGGSAAAGGVWGAVCVPQKVQPLTKSVGKLLGFWRGWRESCGYWAEYFSREKVDDPGGGGRGDMRRGRHLMWRAKARGIPVVLLNPDAFAGDGESIFDEAGGFGGDAVAAGTGVSEGDPREGEGAGVPDSRGIGATGAGGRGHSAGDRLEDADAGGDGGEPGGEDDQ